MKPIPVLVFVQLHHAKIVMCIWSFCAILNQFSSIEWFMSGKEEAAAAESSTRASTSAQQWSSAATDHPATPLFVGIFPYICVYWFLRRHTYISRNLLDYTIVLLTDRADGSRKIEKNSFHCHHRWKWAAFSIEFSLFALIAMRYIAAVSEKFVEISRMGEEMENKWSYCTRLQQKLLKKIAAAECTRWWKWWKVSS